MAQIKYINEIAKIAEEIVKIVKPIDAGCLYMSALMFAIISNRLCLRSKFIIGSLYLNESNIFSHIPIKPMLEGGTNIVASWGGHAWVDVSGIICDLSIFSTIFSDTTPYKTQRIFEELFSRDKLYLIGQHNLLHKRGLHYIPVEELTEVEAALFIKNIENVSNISINEIITKLL